MDHRLSCGVTEATAAVEVGPQYNQAMGHLSFWPLGSHPLSVVEQFF